MEIVCQRIALEGGSEGKFPVVISIRVMYILNHLMPGGEPHWEKHECEWPCIITTGM